MFTRKIEDLRQLFYRRRWFEQLRGSQQFLPIIISCLILVFGVGYLVQTNSLATTGYEVNELESQLQVLKEQNKKLQLQVTDLRSTKSIQERLKHMEMVKVSHVEYITGTSTEVAVAR